MKEKLCLAKVFSDGMVLQRRQPVRVFGTGMDGADVCVEIGEKKACCVVKDGRWCAQLPPMEAAAGQIMRVRSKEETLIVSDVAVGEVWIAGGQSNMEFWLRNEAERDTVIPAADDALLRMFDMPRISYEGQERDISFEEYGKWRPFLPEHAGWFSAVGAYFGIQLRRSLGVPVGIVGCNCGATSASCWMSEEYLDAVPALESYRKNYENMIHGMDLKQYGELFKERQRLGLTPRMQALNERIARGEVALEEIMGMMKNLSDHQRALFTLPEGPMSPVRPFALYHFMVERLAPYTAKGVIWYQGEADEVLPEQYAVLFGQLVKCWRETWGLQLPFLTVQLAPFERWMTNTGAAFPELRRQQQKACAAISGVWMACIMDSGMRNDIHPKQKRVVGERLALLARGKVYGEEQLLCEAPAFSGGSRAGDTLILHFAHSGRGLVCKSAFPSGLEAEADGVSAVCTAALDGANLILRSEAFLGAGHVKVSYAQKPYTEADLYNSAGLCAMPFTACF